MSATLLQLVQQFSRETALFAYPSVAATSSDDGVLQAVGLLNAAGYELQREYDWQWITKTNLITAGQNVLPGQAFAGAGINLDASVIIPDSTYMVSGPGINQGTFVTSSGTLAIQLSQNATATSAAHTNFTFGQVRYTMPSDYDRQIDRTHWDKTRHWEMLGPETAQQWEWLLSGYISTGPRIRYRIFGNYFQIWPMAQNNEVLGFEYISNAWVSSAAAVSGGLAPDQTSLLADTDTCIFPDRLMVLALKRKMWEIKGFDSQAIERDYQAQLSIAKANDAGSPTLSMAPRISSILIGYENIPDSGYGT